MTQLPTVSSGAHDNLVKLNPVDPSQQRSESGCLFEIEKPRKNKADSNGWSKEDAKDIKNQLNIAIVTVEELLKAKPPKRQSVLSAKSQTLSSKTVAKQFRQMQIELEQSLFGGVISDTDESETDL